MGRSTLTLRDRSGWITTRPRCCQAPALVPGYDKASDCVSALNAMRCGKRCTSCGQPTATAILPAQFRASASSGTSTTANPPRCSLVSTNGPSVKMGEPLLGSTLHTAVDASRPPSLKTKTPAAVISSIRALADVALSRSSSSVRSGTHSSLKAIRYSAISSSSAHGQPTRLRLTFSTNELVSIRHPADTCSEPSSSQSGAGTERPTPRRAVAYTASPSPGARLNGEAPQSGPLARAG